MNKQYKLMKEFELAKAILKNGNGDDDEPNLGNEEWPSPGYTDYSDYDRDMDDMEDERNQLLDQGDYHREGMEKNEGDSDTPRQKIATDVWGNEHVITEGMEEGKTKFKPWTSQYPYSSYKEGGPMDPKVREAKGDFGIQNMFLNHKHGSY